MPRASGIGKEITLYSVWFELQVGHHRLPDAHRRADHGGLLQPPVHDQRHLVLQHRADPSGNQRARGRGLCRASAARSSKGAPIFRLDSSTQEAAAETARRKIAEADAALVAARADVAAAEGKIQEARSAYQQAVDELDDQAGAQPAQLRHRRACARSSGSQNAVEGRQGAVAAATAAKRLRRGADLRAPAGSKRPAPKPRSLRPRWSWRRPSSAPA